MIKDISLDILPSGHIRFTRGNEAYNKKMRQIICFLVDGDEKIMSDVNEFFKGSEDIELLIGDTIYCG